MLIERSVRVRAWCETRQTNSNCFSSCGEFENKWGNICITQFVHVQSVIFAIHFWRMFPSNTNWRQSNGMDEDKATKMNNWIQWQTNRIQHQLNLPWLGPSRWPGRRRYLWTFCTRWNRIRHWSLARSPQRSTNGNSFGQPDARAVIVAWMMIGHWTSFHCLDRKSLTTMVSTTTIVLGGHRCHWSEPLPWAEQGHHFAMHLKKGKKNKKGKHRKKYSLVKSNNRK